MDYGKMMKDELISELKSLKSKLEDPENKKPEGELSKAVALMTNVINSTTDLIFVKDMKLRTIMCNKAFANAAGKKPEEMIGKTDIENGWDPELVNGNPEKGIRGFENDDRQALKGNEVHNPMEPGNVGNDIRFFDTQKLPLRDVDGQIFGVLDIARDITERRKIEKELIKAQKLESIGVFAGGIAHDFNNSLQTILGYISLAKIRTNPNDEIYEFLEEAGKAVLQSRDLTHQLLTFSKGGTPVKETVSISELLESATKLVLSGSNVRHELIIPEGLWHIEADRGQLNQVISNLIINADQAMPEGGDITESNCDGEARRLNV